MRFWTSHIAQVALTVLPFVSARSLDRRATVCNGHPELCEKSYGAVSFVGAHNSYAVGTDNFATNQDYNVTQQLTDGIRLLQMQAHQESDGIHLCHTNCFLYDGGLLQAYLTQVKAWMDDNPNEVVTLLIVNSDNVPAAQYGTIFDSVGLTPMAFTPATAQLTNTQWPTLGSMIDAGTRLVTFIDNGADASVPYIMDEFSNVWETAFDVTDPTFDCNVNRTNGDATTQLYLINHFLDKLVTIVGSTSPVPDKDQLEVTNSVEGPGSLGLQTSQCTTQHGRPPNFLLVDFYEFGGGSVFQVAATINGVDYNPTSPIATPKPDTTGTGGTSTGTSSSSAAVDFVIPRALWSGAAAVLVGMVLGALSLA